VALLPEPTVLREVEAKSLIMVPLSTDELVRPLGIIHRRGKELGSTARRFIELLQNEKQIAAAATSMGAKLGDSTAEPEFERNGHSNGNGNGNGHPRGHASLKTNSAEPTDFQTTRPARVKAK
jgi:hypothetical protein